MAISNTTAAISAFSPLGSILVGNAMKADAQEKDYENQLKAQTDQTQMQSDQAAAANNVLRLYQARNDKAIDQNQATFAGALTPYAPGAQAATTADNAARRGSAIDANITEGLPTTQQFRDTDSPAVQKAYDAAMATKIGQSRASGAALGNLGAIGDTWQGNDFSENAARRDIGTTNTIVQNDNANLPAAQQLASFQKSRIIRQAPPTSQTIGNLLVGLGNLEFSAAGAAAGGGGTGGQIGKSLTSMFNSTGA